jgi:hypothetical protein
MGIKSLFIKSDEDSSDKSKSETTKETSKAKFPVAETPVQSTESAFSSFGFGKKSTPEFTPSFNKGEVSQEHLDKAVERYQKGFESLNQPGFDFFEYFQSVRDAGVENPMAYTMAFNMGKIMDKSITKEALISQAQYYESEINKSYQDSITNGNTKKQALISQKDNENQALIQELGYMKEQLEVMKSQIQDRENKLKLIGSKYEPQINEIDSKLGANEMAKSQLIKSIEQVKNGIITNLK